MCLIYHTGDSTTEYVQNNYFENLNSKELFELMKTLVDLEKRTK